MKNKFNIGEYVNLVDELWSSKGTIPKKYCVEFVECEDVDGKAIRYRYKLFEKGLYDEKDLIRATTDNTMVAREHTLQYHWLSKTEEYFKGDDHLSI